MSHLLRDNLKARSRDTLSSLANLSSLSNLNGRNNLKFDFSFAPEEPDLPSRWGSLQTDLLPSFKWRSLTSLFLLLNLIFFCLHCSGLSLETDSLFWQELARQLSYSYCVAVVFGTAEKQLKSFGCLVALLVLQLVGWAFDSQRGALGSHYSVLAIFARPIINSIWADHPTEETSLDAGVTIQDTQFSSRELCRDYSDRSARRMARSTTISIRRVVQDRQQQVGVGVRVYQWIFFTFLVFVSSTSAQWRGYLCGLLFVAFLDKGLALVTGYLPFLRQEGQRM